MDEERYGRRMIFENHKEVVAQSIDQFLTRQVFVDVTLVCSEGKKIKLHRTVLSACSPLFESILIDINDRSHPVLVFNDISEGMMLKIIEFIYKGKTHIPCALWGVFLNIAKKLQIRGLENIALEEVMSQVLVKSLKENMSKSQHTKRKLMHKESPARSAILDIGPRTEKLPFKIYTGREIKVINPFAIQDNNCSPSTEDNICVTGPSKDGKKTISSMTINVPDPIPENDDSDIELIVDNPSMVVLNDTRSNSVRQVTKEQIDNKMNVVYDSDDSENFVPHLKKKKKVDNLRRDLEESAKDAHTQGDNLVDGPNLPGTSELLPTPMIDTVTVRREALSNLSDTEYVEAPLDVLDRYCVICKVFTRNIDHHVKGLHNKLLRTKRMCKKCSRGYYMETSFKIHKCIS